MINVIAEHISQFLCTFVFTVEIFWLKDKIN